MENSAFYCQLKLLVVNQNADPNAKQILLELEEKAREAKASAGQNPISI